MQPSDCRLNELFCPTLLPGPWVLGRSATPGVIEGARYSFSPSRLGPLETEQKAGVRTGKPDFFIEEPMLSTGLHFASESTWPTISTPSTRKAP